MFFRKQSLTILVVLTTSLLLSGCGLGTGYAGPSNINRFYIFVADAGAGRISVLQLQTLSGMMNHVANYIAGTSPNLMRLHPNGKAIYFTDDANQSAGQGQIGALTLNRDTGALTPIATSQSDGLNRPRGLAIHPNGSCLYTTSFDDGTLIRFSISSATGAVSGPLTYAVTGGTPSDVAIDPTGSYLYVTSYITDKVQIFSLNSVGIPTSMGTVYTGNPATPGAVMSPSAISVSPIGGLVFISNPTAGKVTVFTPSGSSLTYLTSLTSSGVLDSAGSLNLQSNGSELYVLDSNLGVETFSVSGHTVTALANYSLGDTPGAVFAGDTNGEWLFAAAAGSSNSLFAYSRTGGGTLGTSYQTSAGSNPSSILAIPFKNGW